jgi:hypothetical protein
MKFRMALLAAVAVIASICIARARDSSTADAERYIKESERLWAETYATGDTALVDRILADDFWGVAPEGNFYDKAWEIKDTRESPKEFLSNRLNDVKVRFYGDAAVAQGSESWVKRDGTRGRYVWTDTWIERSGRWQIVAAEDLPIAEPSK